MATEQATTTVKLPKVRVSYVQLHEPKTGPNGGREVYSLQVLIPKKGPGSELLKALQEAERAAKARARRDPGEKFRNLAIRDGDEDNPKPHTKGHWYINCRTGEQPKVVVVRAGLDGKPENVALTDPREIKELVYSGCFADVVAGAYFYDTAGNKGIAWGLNIVRKRADGERLDGRPTLDDLPELDKADLDDGFGGSSGVDDL